MTVSPRVRPLTLVLAIALAASVGLGAWLVRANGPVRAFNPDAAPVPAEPTAEPPAVTVAGEITSGLTTPWGLAFLPDGSALLTERDTALIKLIPADGGPTTTLGAVDGSVHNGEGGLLGIAVPPGPDPSFLLAYTTTATDNRVVRIGWDGQRLGAQSPILTGIPVNSFHDGGRILASPDGTFFVGTGDAGEPERAQDAASLGGKVLHITADGRPAPGNPESASPVFTSGHRNVQGLAFDSVGRLWASEFGQSDADELNQLSAGDNYGWPVHEGAGGEVAYRDPAVQWSPTAIASPSGIAILDDVAYVASLRGQTLWQVPLIGVRAAEPVALDLGPLGRLRTVTVATDGSLWLVTSNTDREDGLPPGSDRILRLQAG